MGPTAKPAIGRSVFLSYPRDDRPFADRLAQDLRAGGVPLWQDTSEISPGEDWQEALKNGLRTSAALLYVATARSAQSRWMVMEVLLALQLGMRIFTLILDDDGARDLPDELKVLQWIDFRPGYDEAFGTLLEALRPFRSTASVPDRQKQSKGYVFLSYAEEDATFVDDLKRLLAERGYGYWDYRESQRDYHNDLFLELEGVISQAAATLSFLSPDWKRSRTAVKEYHFSIDVGVPVFLLRVVDPGPTLAVAGVPYIDFTKDRESGFGKLHRELTRKGL